MLENELLNFGKRKNFTFDQWLAICWNIIEIMTTIHFSKITEMFATLRNWSISISVNEWTLNSIWACCYFGLHFGWWKVTKLSSRHFPFASKIIEAKIMWSGVSNSHEFNASTTMKAFTNFPLRLFNELVPLFFHPNYSPSFRPQPRLLKYG